MLLAAGVFADALHNEIWVFNQGYWNKDAGLWNEIQKASWEDVILEEDFKEAVKKDIYGFFESEELYKEYSLPWKVLSLTPKLYPMCLDATATARHHLSWATRQRWVLLLHPIALTSPRRSPGKTITIKTIMKEADALGYTPMYVKSFKSEYLAHFIMCD